MKAWKIVEKPSGASVIKGFWRNEIQNRRLPRWLKSEKSITWKHWGRILIIKFSTAPGSSIRKTEDWWRNRAKSKKSIEHREKPVISHQWSVISGTKAKRIGLRAKGKEQRAKSKELRAWSNEKKAGAIMRRRSLLKPLGLFWSKSSGPANWGKAR